MNLKSISDKSLVMATKDLLREETRLGVDVLRHLQKINRRKIYLNRAYGSLFEYCVHELKLSESSAYRRIQALRLMSSVPEVEEKISSGVLHLTTAARVQSFLRGQKEKSASNPVIEPLALIEKVQGLRTREVEKVLIEIEPALTRPEKIRQLDPNVFEMRVSISKELKEKLDLLKLRLSHRKPSMTYEQLLEQVADLALEKLERATCEKSKRLPRRKSARALTVSSALADQPRSRFIPNSVRQKVWRRDAGKCVFSDLKTGHIYGSQYQLQIDHIHPYALGGNNEIKNLRLLCRAHNAHRANRSFGQLESRQFSKSEAEEEGIDRESGAFHFGFPREPRKSLQVGLRQENSSYDH